MNNRQCKLTEGLEYGDLKRLIEPKISIDKFCSKMGDDADVIVVCFTVMSKDPGADLVNFIEKSYDWVLDADLSDGESSDGNYSVFVELEREQKSIERIYNMIEDILNLTEQKIGDWSFIYHKNKTTKPLTVKNLKSTVFYTPELYHKHVTAKEEKEEELNEEAALNHIRSIAGIRVKPRKIIDPVILEMQRVAGIK